MNLTEQQKEWLQDYAEYDSAWVGLKILSLIKSPSKEEWSNNLRIIRNFSDKYFNKK